MAAQAFALASRVSVQRPSLALPASRRPLSRRISAPVQAKLSGPKPSSNAPNVFAVRVHAGPRGPIVAVAEGSVSKQYVFDSERCAFDVPTIAFAKITCVGTCSVGAIRDELLEREKEKSW